MYKYKIPNKGLKCHQCTETKFVKKVSFLDQLSVLAQVFDLRIWRVISQNVYIGRYIDIVIYAIQVSAPKFQYQSYCNKKCHK